MYLNRVLPKHCKGGSWRLIKGPFLQNSDELILKTVAGFGREPTQPVHSSLSKWWRAVEGMRRNQVLWMLRWKVCNTLLESNIAPENRLSHPKKIIIYQRFAELLLWVSGRDNINGWQQNRGNTPRAEPIDPISSNLFHPSLYGKPSA